MPWEFLTYGAEKAEVCERCQCLRFHMKAGAIHFLKFLFKGKWEIGKSWKVAKKRIGFKFQLGDKIAGFFGEIEKRLLKIFGYNCNEDSGKADPCDPDDLEKGTFNKIKLMKYIKGINSLVGITYYFTVAVEVSGSIAK